MRLLSRNSTDARPPSRSRQGTMKPSGSGPRVTRRCPRRGRPLHPARKPPPTSLMREADCGLTSWDLPGSATLAGTSGSRTSISTSLSSFMKRMSPTGPTRFHKRAAVHLAMTGRIGSRRNANSAGLTPPDRLAATGSPKRISLLSAITSSR